MASLNLEVKCQFLVLIGIVHAYHMKSVKAIHSFYLVLEGASNFQIFHSGSGLLIPGWSGFQDSDYKVVSQLQEQVLQRWLQ